MGKQFIKNVCFYEVLYSIKKDSFWPSFFMINYLPFFKRFSLDLNNKNNDLK